MGMGVKGVFLMEGLRSWVVRLGWRVDGRLFPINEKNSNETTFYEFFFNIKRKTLKIKSKNRFSNFKINGKK